MKRLIAICCVILAVFSMTACSNDAPEGHVAIDLYFTNSARDSLVTEKAYINENLLSNTPALVREVMNKLFAGPSSPENQSVIPEGVSLKGVSVSQTERGTVNIDLKGAYYKNSVANELLARYSIVCTLCRFDNIRKVKIYINGKDLCNDMGKGDPVPSIGFDEVLMNSPSSVETQTEKFVSLYFTDKNGRKLFLETRKATMTDNNIEKTIINELIRGPVSDDYVRTLPSETELISVETTEEVCFVNFTEAFLSGIENGSEQEKILVYSVVNSLTRVVGIEKVQILIDGKKPQNDAGQLFSAPLEKNPDIIADIQSK